MAKRKPKRKPRKNPRSPQQIGGYNNQRTIIDGISFASKAESRRYQQLKERAELGQIHYLRVHPYYLLFPAFRDRLGRHHRAISYTADFAYVIIQEDGRRFIVEDVKGPRTPDYQIRVKIFQYFYSQIEFYEIDAEKLRS